MPALAHRADPPPDISDFALTVFPHSLIDFTIQSIFSPTSQGLQSYVSSEHCVLVGFTFIAHFLRGEVAVSNVCYTV